MSATEEKLAYLWLCGCTPLDDRTKVAALRAAKDPARLFSRLSDYCPPEAAEKCASAPSERRKEAERFAEYLETRGYFAVTLLDGDYPESLKAIPDPPLVLYGAGKRELLGARKFCIVGSRITPPWAEKVGRAVSEAVSERFSVVTGLAEGGDRAAIEGALPGGNLISVLPCGLDHCYPAAHAQLKERISSHGLLLTEYRPDEGTAKYAFHARNRILAGLSEGVLVLSAGEKSGALITANFAAEYGRDVFALPYNVGAAQGVGCNELIKKGAYLATGAEDILSVYGMEAEKREEDPLSPEESRVLAALREGGELHAAEIAERAGMRIFEAAAVLSALELKNRAVKSGGNRYTAV